MTTKIFAVVDGNPIPAIKYPSLPKQRFAVASLDYEAGELEARVTGKERGKYPQYTYFALEGVNYYVQGIATEVQVTEAEEPEGDEAEGE